MFASSSFDLAGGHVVDAPCNEIESEDNDHYRRFARAPLFVKVKSEQADARSDFPISLIVRKQ